MSRDKPSRNKTIDIFKIENLGAYAVKLRIFLVMLCLAAYIPLMPVNYFTITDAGGTLLASPVTNGASFITSYIHSVQLSPVIDDYRFVNGLIWGWEERTQSHNAGLPSTAPEHGKLIMNPPWMITRGGRASHTAIFHRVGSDKLGRNTWRLPPFAEISAFEIYPSARVSLSVSIRRLIDSPVVGFK
ncbi:MAG: DUF1850 domain-containing protein [Synergistaceae bacterium]|nr:DUF1850 domain-containing protein [Synergistaceae bacterium]